MFMLKIGKNTLWTPPFFSFLFPIIKHMCLIRKCANQCSVNKCFHLLPYNRQLYYLGEQYVFSLICAKIVLFKLPVHVQFIKNLSHLSVGKHPPPNEIKYLTLKHKLAVLNLQ